MSRASDVRDAIITELKSQFPDETVDKFSIPRYSREDLADGPRIAVRTGGRELASDQGPDTTDVVIEVGVVGVSPEKSGETDAAYQDEEVAKHDEYDGLLESIIALWIPDGELVDKGMADHAFQSIDQAAQFDANQLYQAGVWLSLIQLTYRDTRDE